MFDTYVTKPKVTEYVPYEKQVKIERAPTDESIRLWEEMKEKAYNSILDKIEVHNNVFSGEGFLAREFYHDTICFYYKFVLNGKTFKGNETINHMDRHKIGSDKTMMIHFLYEKVSQQISKMLFEDLYASMDRFNL